MVIAQQVLGRRRQFVLTVLSTKGSYPKRKIRLRDSLYAATPTLVYTAVPAEPPNEFGFSEIGWADVGEIRLWGAMAFAIPEGQGFHRFCPLERKTLCLAQPNEVVAQRQAERLASRAPAQSVDLHWYLPAEEEVSRFYDAMLTADSVLLRGVSCYLKAHCLWGESLLMEEMAINLHISLEAGLSVLRRRLGQTAGHPISYDAVYQFLSGALLHGEALVEFWRDRRDERNMLLHPDSDLGPHAIPPMLADDVYELMDPMLSLYRYILVGAQRPGV